MNYYIQGDAAKAEQIKAAFKAKGIDTASNSLDHDEFLYYSSNGLLYFEDFSNTLLNVFKTNPGYKELELPVQTNFKVGDWVVRKDGETFYGGNYAEQITLIEVDEKGKCIWLSSTSWVNDDAIRPWTLADAKDGDVLMTTKIRSCPFIYRKTGIKNNLAYYYAGIDGNGDFSEGCLKRTLCHFGPVSDVVPATKEQRDLLFQKMKEAGYKWDEKKKELRKIQPHYDIANFHAGMPVLVRIDNSLNWSYALFSHYNKGWAYPFSVACCCSVKQCIPYNNDTKHLLGTADMCDEQYINW